MRFGRLISLVVLLLALTSAMLAAPMWANAAHLPATEVALEAAGDHGHAHGGETADAHDLIDHAHDVPHGLPSWTLTIPQLPQAYLAGMLDSMPRQAPLGLDRPPRQFP